MVESDVMFERLLFTTCFHNHYDKSQCGNNFKTTTDMTSSEPLQHIVGLLVSFICVQGYTIQTQGHF